MNIACTQKNKPEKEDWHYINDVKAMTIIPTGDLAECIVAGEHKDYCIEPFILLSTPGATIKLTGHFTMEVICRR